MLAISNATTLKKSMKSKAVLELVDLKAIAAAAEAEAVKNNWVVSIAIVDDGHALWRCGSFVVSV